MMVDGVEQRTKNVWKDEDMNQLLSIRKQLSRIKRNIEKDLEIRQRRLCDTEARMGKLIKESTHANWFRLIPKNDALYLLRGSSIQNINYQKIKCPYCMGFGDVPCFSMEHELLGDRKRKECPYCKRERVLYFVYGYDSPNPGEHYLGA